MEMFSGGASVNAEALAKALVDQPDALLRNNQRDIVVGICREANVSLLPVRCALVDVLGFSFLRRIVWGSASTSQRNRFFFSSSPRARVLTIGLFSTCRFDENYNFLFFFSFPKLNCNDIENAIVLLSIAEHCSLFQPDFVSLYIYKQKKQKKNKQIKQTNNHNNNKKIK